MNNLKKNKINYKKERKKGKQITVQNILKKYKNMKKPKTTFLVNEEDLATIDYIEPQEDLFAGESIINAANKVIDFEQFKKQQEKILQISNDLLMDNAETINFVDDLNLNDAMENKNLKMAAKRISDKYKKIWQKRKAPVPIEILHQSSETFKKNDKKGKKQRDKAALIAARKVSKKYRNLYRRL